MSGAPKQKRLQVPTHKGLTVEQIMDLPIDKVGYYTRARVARKLRRGLSPQQLYFLEKVRKARIVKQKTGKSKVLKTHLRDMIILPDMVGLTIAVHNGKIFTPVEVKHNMLGQYLAEFSLSYKIVKHGKAGVGATRGSSSVSLK
ncbi:Ribosomal protein S15 [Spironucleus salmonicida]|uniref:Ribosomal protein S15 n=1 Tax=Spironucleus salmonicida TaxID=348837 RepID=V6M5Q8_9EUKA|nr:Ribosomal protein S15 [Spironucleus salmonicida]|eukprot:EST48669.1 Ribosomal protein S15 [Spironucleus salmonicida]